MAPPKENEPHRESAIKPTTLTPNPSTLTNPQISSITTTTTTTQSSPEQGPPYSQPHPPSTSKDHLEARRAIISTLTTIGTSLTQESQLRLQDLHSNTAAISTQESQLKKQIGNLERQNRKWGKVVEGSLGDLKELGDLQNWAEVLERELLVLEEVVERMDGRGEGGVGDVR